jgi:hypothetical protein
LPIGAGLGDEPIEPAGGGIALQLTVPFLGIELGKPCTECRVGRMTIAEPSLPFQEL